MNDETISTIFRTATSLAQAQIDAKMKESKDLLTETISREKFYSEMTQQLRAEIAGVIGRGRQQESPGREFYERELSNLAAVFNKRIVDLRDESMRHLGSIAAFEVAMSKISELPDVCESELKKAKDIQERASNGELGKPRKLGTRPDRIRDIKNYVEAKSSELEAKSEESE